MKGQEGKIRMDVSADGWKGQTGQMWLKFDKPCFSPISHTIVTASFIDSVKLSPPVTTDWSFS